MQLQRFLWLTIQSYKAEWTQRQTSWKKFTAKYVYSSFVNYLDEIASLLQGKPRENLCLWPRSFWNPDRFCTQNKISSLSYRCLLYAAVNFLNSFCAFIVFPYTWHGEQQHNKQKHPHMYQNLELTVHLKNFLGTNMEYFQAMLPLQLLERGSRQEITY